MSIIVVTLSVFICHISSTDVMLQYEASEVTGDQMPDQVNVTFSTETKSLTKLNLRRSRHFNLDIPLYTLDTDQEGIFHRHKVKTRPKKDLGFYQDITNKAVFRIQRSSEKSAYKKSKFNLKGEFLLNTSKCLFDSEKKTLKKPWRNMPPKPMSNSRWTASPRPLFNTTFDQYVYTLEILKTTTFDLFDRVRIHPPKEKTVRMNAINIRDMHMNNTGRKSNQSKLRSVPQSRRRRNSVQDYFVDVVAVIDYKRYSMFLAQANYNNFAAMQNILEYYAFVFSGADMLYEGIKHPEYTIHILLSKVYVLQTVASSSFIDRHASDDEIYGDTALPDLRAFIIGAGRSIVGIYDHVMLFTGYDLYTLDNNNDKQNTLGIAYNNEMCLTNGGSSSMIEDREGYSTYTIDTVAHELAHGLSARHDGENNLCNPSERYIMGSPDAEKEPGTEYNPWLFSPCSVSYFTSFLKEKLKSSRGYTCLVYAIEASADIPDVSDKLLGQVIKPDQQCQQFYGNDSFFCRVCINGQCVSDPYAPQLDENCAFGDRPDNSCYGYIKEFIGKCYTSIDYQSCCDLCNNVSRPVKGCEYGDRIIDCTQDHCLNSQVDCCGTCNYGTPFTPTYSTRRNTPKRSTTVNPLVLFTSIKGCEPGDQDLRPELCTNLSVCLIQPAQCCHYCSFYFTYATTSTTTVTECVLGEPDLYPELCTSPSICQTQPLMCCEYCSSASRLSLYTIWIEIYIIRYRCFLHCVLLLYVY
ncbi:uncharacterized protein LOC106058577 isoform X3 [Biomphalaria glabrata]|uniref:Uncharacterized protein LOC106058577 isoform X3 n=1 Tax=Biomphalaria glabrata TaxID=6526 RepID=A0A9W3B3T1_BIOGL|nr:uncharacterized protein LOC106058577 isoform X3 [Biomphalaria glabrata]